MKSGAPADPADRHGRLADLHPNADVVSQTMGDELLLVHVQTQRVHALNSTARRLWELLSEGADRQAIELQLATEFDVEGVVLAVELDQILAQLADAELLLPGR